MSEFAPRWAYWPNSGGPELLHGHREKKTRPTSHQRTDKTDRTPFDGFVGSVAGRGRWFSESSALVAWCWECRKRKAAGVAVLACGTCGFKTERKSPARRAGRQTHRCERGLAGLGARLRLIDGAGGRG